MSEPYLSEIRMVGFNFAPRGWASCEGQLLPISQNQALFSLLGTTFGGDGRTTFGLPGLRGRAPIHEGNGPGLSSRRLGDKGGVERVTLDMSQTPMHEHATLASSNPGDTESPADAVWAVGGAAVFSDHDNAHMGSGSSSVGGGQHHENMQPFLTLKFCIALQGIFPSW